MRSPEKRHRKPSDDCGGENGAREGRRERGCAAAEVAGQTPREGTAAGAIAASFKRTAWGETLAATGSATTPLGWLGDWGYYEDSARRRWVRERSYDARWGRWLSAEPMGAAADLELYRYAAGNPNALVDPWGTDDLPWYYDPRYDGITNGVGNFLAGAGDAITLGATGLFRRYVEQGLFGIPNPDYSPRA